jgi:RimK family alpha-L-glutamate ligase
MNNNLFDLIINESSRKTPKKPARKLDRTPITVVVLTSISAQKPGLVSNMIKKSCDKTKIPCHLIDVTEAWVSHNDIEKGTLLISNIDGEDTSVKLDTNNLVCFVRSGALGNEIGQSLVSTIEKSGAFMVNNLDNMLVCDNKMSTASIFERDNISTPRTSLVSNEKSIDDAHERIGGDFPVIIKTITGTQGIGVSIVNDYQSMVSVIQSLWKFDAHLIIQEYMEFEHDIRTIVLGGKILASTKRIKADDDFRSNRHRGASTAPYKLSDDERELILIASRSMGTYMTGVDHVLVDGEVYILECNGSPGIGSNFNLYDLSHSESNSNEFIGKTTPEIIVDKIMDYISIDNHRRLSFTTECGYVEKINIEGYGDIRAKFDTGNGTKASMFVVDKINITDGDVRWEKGGHKFKSKLQGVSSPEHVDTMDDRPIVHVDIRFNNKLYTDVPIGLSVKDAKSTFLVNRDLLARFRVHVNPIRRFALSEWISRSDGNDTR